MLVRSKISYLIFSLIIISAFSGIGFPQNISYLDSLDGKFGMQFQISNNFTLSDFQGTVISGKYQFSMRDAIRLGVSLNLGESDLESDVNYIDTALVSNAKQDESRFDIIINTQYIRYINVSESIAFLGGVGPFIKLSDITRERVTSLEGIEEKSESQTNGFSLGLDLIAGVEWWFNKSMSLSAEYGLNFEYRSMESNNKDDEKEIKTETTSTYLTGNRIRFGITVYF